MHAILRAIGCVALYSSAAAALASDFTVAPNISGGLGHYFWSIGIEGATAVANPPLYLARGNSYTFDVNANVGHPFWINAVQGTGTLNAYSGSGLSANGVSTATTTTITFDVPADAPDTLFYDCQFHPEMTGPIHIVVFRDGFD